LLLKYGGENVHYEAKPEAAEEVTHAEATQDQAAQGRKAEAWT
jgi:hypothetical protein